MALPGFHNAVTIAPEHCAGLVGFEWQGKSTNVADFLRTNNRILIGGTESYGGVFGIPESAPRGLLCANMAVFTSPADVDLFAERLEAFARIGGSRERAGRGGWTWCIAASHRELRAKHVAAPHEVRRSVLN